MRIKWILLGLTGAAFVSGPVLAEMHGKGHGHGQKHGGQGHMAHMMFNKADTDNDDMVSYDEFMAFHEDMFDSADTDGDDMISREEMMNKREEMREKRMKNHETMMDEDAGE